MTVRHHNEIIVRLHKIEDSTFIDGTLQRKAEQDEQQNGRE